jgi:hypothetical protein
MWRRLKARAHPDAGGDHELFIWTGSVEELVCGTESHQQGQATGDQRPQAYQAPGEEPARIPYPSGTDFRGATQRALQRAAAKPDGYGQLLSLLEDCWPLLHLWREQERGASLRRLAAIGHIVGMGRAERSGWYRVAESIPLSDRHAGHILKRLKERAA